MPVPLAAVHNQSLTEPCLTDEVLLCVMSSFFFLPLHFPLFIILMEVDFCFIIQFVERCSTYWWYFIDHLGEIVVVWTAAVDDETTVGFWCLVQAHGESAKVMVWYWYANILECIPNLLCCYESFFFFVISITLMPFQSSTRLPDLAGC